MPITVRSVCFDKETGERSVHQNAKCDVLAHNLRFEVVAGHRRLSACKIAGIIKINCVVRVLSDEEVFAVMTAENLAREDVPLLDECRHYEQALKRFGKSIKEIAQSARKSEQYIKDRLVIAEMPEYMQVYLQNKEIKLGAALALVQIEDDSIRHMWTDQAVRDGVSVAQAEYWLYGWKKDKLPGGVYSETPPSGYMPGVSPGIQFECFFDGKKYPAKLFRSVMVFEDNIPILLSLIVEYSKQSEQE